MGAKSRLVLSALLLGLGTSAYSDKPIAPPMDGVSAAALVKKHVSETDRLLVLDKRCHDAIPQLSTIKSRQTLFFPDGKYTSDISQWNVTDLFYKTGMGSNVLALFCNSTPKERTSLAEILEANMLVKTAEYRNKTSVLLRFERKSGPLFEGRDQKRPHISIGLQPVLRNSGAVTDIQAHPDYPNHLFVAWKWGALRACNMNTGKCDDVLQVDTFDDSELGLLGIAFHPKFSKNRRLFLRYNVKDGEALATRLSEFRLVKDGWVRDNSVPEKILLQVEQAGLYHAGGQIAFGPDGYLYVGFGDGSSTQMRGLASFRSKIIRIDIDTPNPDGKKSYSVPKDNPFVGKPGALPEIWASGLRNPWRFSFDPTGRLIVADVGEVTEEEISIVERGRDYGWNIKEGWHCAKSKAECAALKDSVDPVLSYGREDGSAVIGGYTYTANDGSELVGKYIFGDGVTGRIWATDLSGRGFGKKGEGLISLGRWPLFLSSFGRDSQGRVFVASVDGKVFRIVPRSTALN